MRPAVAVSLLRQLNPEGAFLMKPNVVPSIRFVLAMLVATVAGMPPTDAQEPPYDVFPAVEPPVWRVRYEAASGPDGLAYPVSYTLWVPPGVKTLRGVVVHQHGCGEGSCKSGLTAAHDLHWQALARAHDCGLLGPSYEQPEGADCQLWCDPRNGSAAAFQQALVDLGEASGHPELAEVPWALWGHSGGGHWCGGMVMLFPERVAAAWLRSGVPLFAADPNRAGIKPHTLPDAALGVPMMCNPGTKEGVTVKDGRFAGVWPANQRFFETVRGAGGLLGVAVDPLTAHECGNQRYLAIPWLDACLEARLPASAGEPLRPMPAAAAWLGPITGGAASPIATWSDPLSAAWLPNEAVALKWMAYVTDTAVVDDTPPPAPVNLQAAVGDGGVRLSWEPLADLESGVERFVVQRDGERLGQVPEEPKNPFGRPLFQGLQYSDTPLQPLAIPQLIDADVSPGVEHVYRVRAVSTSGRASSWSDPITITVPAA